MAINIPLSLVGASDPVRSAREALTAASTRRGPVLVSLEAGCRPREIGKALHSGSRADLPFVAVDCASPDAAEVDRRLFGTASSRDSSQDLETVGVDAAVVEAGQGTLYLENIDELPASTQRRLSRVVRDAEVKVAGNRAPSGAAFRLIGSTSKDLDVEVREGRFRSDLLRRFAARITVPPVRQRPQDVPAIIQRVIEDAGRSGVTFTAPAMTVLSAMPWTGNVDELSAVIIRILEGTNGQVKQEDVLTHLRIPASFTRPDLTASLREARRRFERDYIAAVLERHQWRMTEAARTLGIERANLYRKARQLGITRGGRTEISTVNR